MKESISVGQVYQDLKYKILAGKKGLNRMFNEEMIQRPGLEFAGYTKYYNEKRIVLIGSKENEFLKLLPLDIQKERVEYLFSLNPPAFVFSKNATPPQYFLEFGNKYNIPIFKSDMKTTPTSSKLFSYLQSFLAERICVSGVMLDINGMGTLIIGKSGTGKSETAVELIKRGHQLISDDMVNIYQKEVGTLVAEAPKILKNMIEIRGVGMVDVTKLFGIGSIRDNQEIKLVIELETWNPNKLYGLQSESVKYFDTEINKITIPILPGRNVALLVESAVLNEKLKGYGIDTESDFAKLVQGTKGDSQDE